MGTHTLHHLSPKNEGGFWFPREMRLSKLEEDCINQSSWFSMLPNIGKKDLKNHARKIYFHLNLCMTNIRKKRIESFHFHASTSMAAASSSSSVKSSSSSSFTVASLWSSAAFSATFLALRSFSVSGTSQVML